MTATAPPEPQPKKKAVIAKGWLALGVAAVATAALFSVLNSERPPAARPAAQAPATTAAPLGPAEEIDRRVREALGPSNRGMEKVAKVTAVPEGQVEVRWAVNGSPTTELLKDLMRQEVLRTLQAVKEAAQVTRTSYEEVVVSATYELTDAKGNASEEVIASARYPWSALQRADLGKLNFKEVFELAEESEVHRAFQY